MSLVKFTDAISDPDLIITNEQYTINGWIDFHSDARNMAACNFKLCKNCEVTTFLPGEIFGYRFLVNFVNLLKITVQTNYVVFLCNPTQFYLLPLHHYYQSEKL